LDENNSVIDAHLAGKEGTHRFVTGKLVHVGKMKDEIKLQTAQGEQVFPLLHQETKTKALEEGANVTVELNEAGTVIYLHRAGEHSPVKK
jgi:DNA/RNA-binding domain of Phe-tRNA-synthetase-like protein